ncbi:glycosyltransferase family 2 protein [Ilumatobacter nonamiensis]|uniref:glycosyltransferase family 2 protein n=1 Tax=Ilumatobacter nonamiensis TaxID=467093 RepID=UPI00034C2DEC|nr:galactosyltransferase-related protein [Ilumatobacter nonamiensis]
MRPTTPLPVAIVTVARHRRAHLTRQREWVQRNARGAAHVIVDMGGDRVDDGPEVVVRHVVADDDPLPIAAARNLGARSVDADVIIFLDVDCLPSPRLVPTYVHRVTRYGGVWSGPVGYLPPETDIDDWSVDSLTRVGHFHDGRPRPAQPMETLSTPDLFWSLSFAIRRQDWDEVGGFDERYRGYGGEDTDFAHTLAEHGIRLWADGEALAFHQHHPVGSPPVDHLEEIVANATIFHEKWGHWPMRGWLSAFRDLGLIDWHPGSVRIVVGSPTVR